MKARTLLCVALCVLALIGYFAVTAEAKPNCEGCLKAGYPYLCRATINSGVCFQNAGDVTCDGDGCVCCRKTATTGCESCEDNDEVDDDDEDI
jgi:hypothetical protein